jgi:hypothetical protein
MWLTAMLLATMINLMLTWWWQQQYLMTAAERRAVMVLPISTGIVCYVVGLTWGLA